MRNISAIVVFSAVETIFLFGAVSLGHEKLPVKPTAPLILPEGRPPADKGPRASFSLDSPEEMAQLSRNLEAACIDCVDFLHEFAQGKSKDEKKARWATSFLGEIRADDERSVLALCANIGKPIPTNDEGWGAPHSLTGRGAAWALVRIGGSRAKDIMIGRMRHDLTEYELRTYAYVFNSMDKAPLTIRQLELAIEREKKTPLHSSPSKQYLERLEFIKEVISKPGYLSDQKNWPSRRL